MRIKNGYVYVRVVYIFCELPKNFNLDTEADSDDTLWLDFISLYNEGDGKTEKASDETKKIMSISITETSPLYLDALSFTRRVDEYMEFKSGYSYWYSRSRLAVECDLEKQGIEVPPTDAEEEILEYESLARDIVEEIVRFNENDVSLTGQFVYFNPETEELEVTNVKDFHVEPIYIGELVEYDPFELLSKEDMTNKYILLTIAEKILEFAKYQMIQKAVKDKNSKDDENGED